MKEIDWSGWTPEYPYWVECDNRYKYDDYGDWHCLEGNRYYDRNRMFYNADSDCIRVYTKPNNPWIDCLPPVGTECEFLNHDGRYVKCTIVGHYDRKVIARPCDMNETAYIKEQKWVGGDMVFRPIKNDDSSLVDELTEVLMERTWSTTRDLAAHIISKGYRK